MKKILVVTFCFISLLTILQACSAGKNASASATSATKVNNGTITGTWTISNIALEDFPTGYSVKNAFDTAPYQDFESSTWIFNGNYTGSFTLAGGNTQSIFWSLIKNSPEPVFQFKKLNEGEKAADIKTGYRMIISSATDETLVLKSAVETSPGNTGYVTYTFTKSPK